MRRFFSNDSFWNKPIAKDAETDPHSDHFIELLANEPNGNFFGINLHRWTMRVYEVTPQTPRVKVATLSLRGKEVGKWANRADRFRHSPDFDKMGVPIPPDARTDPEADAHIAFVDWTSMLAWDMWAARRRDDGQWESCTGMVYRLDGSGVFATSDFAVKNGESIHFYGPSRAAGVPAIAGLIMYDEVKAGRIEHKLAFASRSNAYQQFVWPAAWTDGHKDGGIPEGAVIQLDPALDLDQFDLSPGGRVVARALQEYGAVDVDNAGGNALYGEGLWGHPTKSWPGLLDPFALKSIPMEHYRILKLGEIVPLGDTRPHRSANQKK